MKLQIVVIVITITLFCCQNKKSGKHRFISSQGTTVLIIVTPDTIRIAADTKAVSSLGRDSVSHSQHKIYQTNNIYFAFTNTERIISVITGHPFFYPKRTMDSVIKKEREFHKSFETFTDTIMKELSYLIDSLTRNLQVNLISPYIDNAQFLEVAMATFISEVPAVVVRSFGFTKRDGIILPVIKQTLQYDGTHNVLAQGFRSNIMTYLNKDTAYLHDDGKTINNKMTCLISLEANDSIAGRYVGLPVDIVAIGKHEPVWYYGLKHCANAPK